VEASLRVKVLKGVTEEGAVCAELLLSSRENRWKDWIDEG